MFSFPAKEKKMAAVKHNKIKLREVNRHLVCRLCRGYYVDATTIAECLHSFCRSCIIKYLEKNSFCPICEVQIHKTKPYLNLRLDKALQDVVYKLVPGLYHDEMKRRREFYSKHQEEVPITTPEQCGLEERIIFSPEDSISLSLEYLESDDYESETVSSQSSESGDNPEGLSFPQQLGLMKLKNNEGRNSRRESQDVQENTSYPKRYLQCPAVVNVSHLKKFIRMKHDLTDKMQVDIIHKRVPLPDHYTLMDVAYIYTWKRSAPLRFLYQIYQTKKQKVKILPTVPEVQEPKPEIKNENPKSDEAVIDEKLRNGVIEKPAVEVNKSIKSEFNKEPSENKILTREEKVSSEKSGVKIINSPKPVGKVKPDPDSKSGTNKETEKEVKLKEKNKTTVDPSKVNKSDNLVIKEENKKVDEENNKTEKVEKCESAKIVRENDQDSNKDRLLLNPISGQLESVPSTVQKPVANGTVVEEVKKETVETVKISPVVLSPKNSDSENHKDGKKSNVNLLKSFRKDKSSIGKESKVEVKNSNGNSLTITPVIKTDNNMEKEATKVPIKNVEKGTVKVSIEIKAENKSSEYDFDGSSSPGKIVPLQEFSKFSRPSKFLSDHKEKWLSKESKNNWIPLQDFRLHMLKENENDSNEDPSKKYKRKSVPSLYRIGTEGNKKSCRKTPNGKIVNDKPKGKKVAPTVINIHTENGDSGKKEITIEVAKKDEGLPPRPITIENKGGEYSIKQGASQSFKQANELDTKTSSDEKKREEEKAVYDNKKDKNKVSLKKNQEKPESENPKKAKTSLQETKNNNFGAIDLTKSENGTRTEKNPLENLMDMAGKSGTTKTDEKMVEALISAAQKQSIEPLLKIPQLSQNGKGSSQGSPPAGKNISPYDISQALQFFKDLRSDLKVLEAKSQLNPNSFLEQFSQKSAGLEPIQLYQQHIDLIRRLKRQQMTMNDSDTPQRKHPKLSPSSEPKKKLSPMSDGKSKILDEAAKLKSSVDRTLSQIQKQMDIQSRLVAAQNYKNFPALLQFYNRTSSFGPGPTSPSKSNPPPLKPSSHSPNSGKSPQCLTPPSGGLPLSIPTTESFFNSQSYSHLINAGLNSEMTFHQMFQNYLNQQEKLNQIKHSGAAPKKPGVPSPKSLTDMYYGPQVAAKKPESGSIATAQKT